MILKSKKKILFIAAAMFLTLIFMVVTAVTSFAASGKTGSVDWEVNGDTLHIFGSGAMADYSSWKNTPWYYVDGKYLYKTVKNIRIDDGVTKIGENAFAYFYYVENISVGNTVETIGDYAFYEATYYAEKDLDLVLPETLRTIGEEAFYKALHIKNVYIKSDVLDINYAGFYGCDGLVNLAIGSTTEAVKKEFELRDEAFENCEHLENVFLANSLEWLYEDAFEDCYAIKNFYYGGTEHDFYTGGSYGSGVQVVGSDNDHLLNTIVYAGDIYKYTMSAYDRTQYTYQYKIENWVFAGKPFDMNGVYTGNMDYIKSQDYTFNTHYHWYVLPDGTPVKKELHTGPGGFTNHCTTCGGKTAKYICPTYYTEYSKEMLLYTDLPAYSYVDKSPYRFLTEYVAGKNECVLTDGFYIVDAPLDFGDTPVVINGDVKLALVADCGITTNGGVIIEDGKTLTTYYGSLPADGQEYGYIKVTGAPENYAGIGGRGVKDVKTKNVTIKLYGGLIEAHGGTHGAGIGSSYCCASVVDIRSGCITAYGGGDEGAAGIGGINNAKSDVTIQNCGYTHKFYVRAYGDEGGAGIGGGDSKGEATVVRIYAANAREQKTTVEAVGGYSAAGIGASAGAHFNIDVEIYGGDIVARGGDNAAGIGLGEGSWDGSAAGYGTFTINDGNIKAYGGEDAAGIGSGLDSGPCKVIINGGTVEAWCGRMYNIAIGRGENAQNVDLSIAEDAIITADGEIDTTGTATILSGGNIAIIAAVAGIAAATSAAVIVITVKKKKKENKAKE